MVNLVHLKRNRPRYFHVGTDDAFRPIHFADRIDVRHEIATARKRTTRQFHLEFLFRSSYPNAIILANRFEQVDALVTEPVSGVSLRIRQGSVLVVQALTSETSERFTRAQALTDVGSLKKIPTQQTIERIPARNILRTRWN